MDTQDTATTCPCFQANSVPGAGPQAKEPELPVPSPQGPRALETQPPCRPLLGSQSKAVTGTESRSAARPLRSPLGMGQGIGERNPVYMEK